MVDSWEFTYAGWVGSFDGLTSVRQCGTLPVPTGDTQNANSYSTNSTSSGAAFSREICFSADSGIHIR